MKKKNISWVNQPNATRDSNIELELCFTLMLFQGSFFGNEKNELQEEEAVKSNEIHDNTNLTHFHNHKLET